MTGNRLALIGGGKRRVGRPIDNHKSTGWHTVDTQLKALQPEALQLEASAALIDGGRSVGRPISSHKSTRLAYV